MAYPLQDSCPENSVDRVAWRAPCGPWGRRDLDTTEHTHTELWSRVSWSQRGPRLPCGAQSGQAGAGGGESRVGQLAVIQESGGRPRQGYLHRPRS